MQAAPLPSLTDPRLPPGADLLQAGRAMARDWTVGPCPFLTEHGLASETEWKRRITASGRIMQHAHIGFRNVDRTISAIAEVHEQCSRAGITVDRLGGSCREFFHGPNNGEPKLQPHHCRNVARSGGSNASGLYGINELLPSGAATI